MMASRKWPAGLKEPTCAAPLPVVVLAIDPGGTDTGWAVFVRGCVQSCGKGDTEAQRGNACAIALAQSKLHGLPLVVAIEKAHPRSMKSDGAVHSLIENVGRWKDMCERHGIAKSAVCRPYAATWHAAMLGGYKTRVFPGDTKAEARRVVGGLLSDQGMHIVPASPDVIDALAIGFWASTSAMVWRIVMRTHWRALKKGTLEEPVGGFTQLLKMLDESRKAWAVEQKRKKEAKEAKKAAKDEGWAP